MRKILLVLMVLTLALSLAGCGEKADTSKKEPAKESAASKPAAPPSAPPAAPTETAKPAAPAASTPSAPAEASKPAQPPAAPKPPDNVEARYQITTGVDKEITTISRLKDGRWTAKFGDKNYGLQMGDKITFYLPDGTGLSVQHKADKYKLMKGKDVYLEVRPSKDKLKVIKENKENRALNFKTKDDKVKVYIGEKDEVGYVKYYAENGKLKAKNKKGEELAVTKDIAKLSPALAPFLFNKSLNQDDRAFLAMLFLSMDK
ncbi:MAG: hypothetical protein AB1641_05670 [Thermodesulfobacteriota bacterium]